MTLLTAPLWLQVALVAEGLVVLWLTWRFGWRGLGWSLVGAAGFWFVLGLVASFLVSRLEGGDPGLDLVPGAALATLRLAQAGWPLIVAGAALGGLLRRLSPRKPSLP